MESAGRRTVSHAVHFSEQKEGYKKITLYRGFDPNFPDERRQEVWNNGEYRQSDNRHPAQFDEPAQDSVKHHLLQRDALFILPCRGGSCVQLVSGEIESRHDPTPADRHTPSVTWSPQGALVVLPRPTVLLQAQVTMKRHSRQMRMSCEDHTSGRRAAPA